MGVLRIAYLLSVIFIGGYVNIHYVNADLSGILHHYETLQIEDLGHRIVKRSLEGDHAEERHLHFVTLGREFRLHLRIKKRIASRQLHVVSVDEHNKETSVNTQLHNFYEGYVYDEPWTSDAQAFFDDDGTLTATIKTKADTYSIEPNWRHTGEELNSTTMIVYRVSDLKMDKDLGESFCGYVQAGKEGIQPSQVEPMPPGDDEIDPPHHEHSQRRKRDSSRFSFVTKKKICPLFLVADYRFFRVMGQSSRSKTVNYLIGLVDRVDVIFRKTVFSGGYTDMGFEVKEIRIHESYTNEEGHYNEQRKWKTRDLLTEFSTDSKHSQYCLSHLFTAHNFPEGTLGLSYVASSVANNPGGICSQVFYKDDRQLYLNTGWSSSLNRYDRRLLTQEADLVTTHEFGHNWGSEHDPDSSECSPSSSQGGKHIMYTYSVSGYEENNKVFSNCSTRSIGGVLQAKSHLCFTEESSSFCGNFEVEGDEQCDAGHRANDKCCDDNCRLIFPAVCSDENDECCQDCRFAPTDFVCQQALNGSCLGQSNCTGLSGKCPEPEPQPIGHPCLNSGECEDGICKSLCERNHMVSCVCDDPAQSCKLCCRSDNGNCSAFVDDDMVLNLTDGSPCTKGICEQGICKKQIEDLVARFWDIIENISPDALVKFMRSNIVGTIIILSLFIWLPASCFISYVDRKRQRENDRLKYGPDTGMAVENEWETPPVKIKRVEGMKSRQPLKLNIPPPEYEEINKESMPSVYNHPRYDYKRFQSII